MGRGVCAAVEVAKGNTIVTGNIMWRLFAIVGIAMSAWISPAQAEILLKCETAEKLTQEGQDWFVAIEDPTVGGHISIKQIYSTGTNEEIYRIWESTKTEIRASLFNEDKQEVDVDGLLTIDRETGRVWKGRKVTVRELENFWNEEKKQMGGFEKDTWWGTNFNCVVGKKLF